MVRPIATSPLESQKNAIIGNTVLYGATAGQLYAAGRAGERFAVRNSGAVAVVEGCGSNGCEYMTGGRVAILGSVGENFGAGMTGGMAFILDRDDSFENRLNDDTCAAYALETDYWADVCRRMVEDHFRETHSTWAETILNEWDRARGMIKHVVPHEIIGKLEHPLTLNETVQVGAAE